MDKWDMKQAEIQHISCTLMLFVSLCKVCIFRHHLLALLKQCMWECHLWALSAAQVEEADRLWGSLLRLQGLCLIIHFKSVSRQPLERHYSSKNLAALHWSACSCSSIKAPRPSSACRGSFSGVRCPVSLVYITVAGMQLFRVKVSFYCS